MKRAVTLAIAALLAACITPYGPESILVTSRIFSLGDTLGMIAEWRAPDFQKQPLQELVLLVDQGVRTWGDVRLVLAAGGELSPASRSHTENLTRRRRAMVV